MTGYADSSYIDRMSGVFGEDSARKGYSSALNSSALNTSGRYVSPTRSTTEYQRSPPSGSYSQGNLSGSREFARSSTSVLAAFRELQSKAKRLEISRSDTIRQCEDLRDAIARTKRAKELWQRQNENDTMETMLSLKAQCEQIRRNKDDFHSKVKMLEEQNNSHQRNIVSQRARLSNLEEDVNQINSKIRSEKFRAESTARDLSQLESRCDNLDDEVIKSPLKHRKQANQKKEALSAIETQIDNVKRATFKTQIKAEALKKYIDMLMNINGDLCTTLTAREMTKEKILELAKKYAPPRYSWPKHFEYVDMVKLLTDAAMTAAKDGALARATAATMAAVGLSPYKSSSPLKSSVSMNSSHFDNSASRMRSHSAPSSRRVTVTDSSNMIQSALLDELKSTSLGRMSKKSVGKKLKLKKKAKFDDSNPNAIDIKLSKAAAKIAQMDLATHSPDIDAIPSYRLALSARTRQGPEYISPTATRSIGPAIHADNEGVFIPSGLQSSRESTASDLHNEYARRSADSRARNQSVAQFHSTVKSFHGDTF